MNAWAPPMPEPFFIPLGDARLAALLHRGREDASLGVLVVVGGPQYRVGSHRQFLLLARRLATAGIPCLRFDVRGMGDSSGSPTDYLHSRDDIHAAIDAFRARCPGLRGVVLWGLCDGAAAILLHAATRAEVEGLVLLNPWVRQDHTHAQSLVRHYYWNRLRSRDFWRKLAQGGVNIAGAIGGVLSALRQSRGAREKTGDTVSAPTASTYITRMATQWQRCKAPSLVLLSGDDLVAAEFRGLCRDDQRWRALLRRPQVRCIDLPDADHTFSSARHRAEVEALTLEFVQALEKRA